MPDINEKMLHLLAIADHVHLEFSEYTGQWFVEAPIEIGGDGFLRGGTEHAPTPEQAINAYWEMVTTVDREHYLVSRKGDQRRHWRWNGAAFAEQPYTYPKPSADA